MREAERTARRPTVDAHAGAGAELLRLPAAGRAGRATVLPPETAALVRDLRRGRGGALFPCVARMGPDGLTEAVRTLGGAQDAQAISAALSRPAFRPWIEMVEGLGTWCRQREDAHGDLFRRGLLRPRNAELFAPLVGGAFVRCAIGGDGCADEVRRAWEDFRAFFERFAARLRRDLRGGAFGGEVEGPVSALWAAPSETHNGRQRVLCLRMRGGRRIAYKPRPVDGERIFLAAGSDASIFEWLNDLPEASGPVRLPTLRVWRGRGRDRRTYSWQEWIEPPKRRTTLHAGTRCVEAPCLTPREAATYWRSGGALAAACYAFGVTDLGDGNLLAGRRRGAAGPLPYIVDLEVFACPLQRLSGTGLVEPAAHRGRAHPGFPAELRADEAEGPATAFFAAPGGGLRLRRVAASWARRETRTLVADTLGNAGYAAYLLPMLRGMFDLWTRIGLHRERLLARLRRDLRGGRVRALVKYSATYAQELERRLPPSGGARRPRSRSRFSAEERAQLARGDVPYFFTPADGGALQWLDGPGCLDLREAGPQHVEEPTLLPNPAMLLEGRNLGFVALAVPMQDAIAHVHPQLAQWPEVLRDADGLRLRDPALGVDLRIRDERTGSASFDWNAAGRRVTFSWDRRRIRVEAEPLPPARPRQRAVAARLLRIQRADAPLRAAWAAGGFRDREAGRQLQALTAAALAWLEDVLDAHGWPSEAMVGREAGGAASRLAQHAGPGALAFQRRCLREMRAAAALGEVPWREVAYLADAVSVNAGRRQRYGTKFRKRRGRLEPYPLEAPGAVDARRRRMGLGPLGEYRRTLERVYGARMP
ncbi:type 2 lantipeptide synthetase LanM [Luteimonas sp. Y-2-2-4F]|nr:type 2 lantipeptide synthetase LanM [Luteimonas sp. Y-2-2-4F]MCD9030913.1 type 2 lantipeptide synthetase LanM [Luteimonas sp. Y-2-2-4F]